MPLSNNAYKDSGNTGIEVLEFKRKTEISASCFVMDINIDKKKPCVVPSSCRYSRSIMNVPSKNRFGGLPKLY